MTLIRCPKCGQTVLSVATTCPKCHHLLSQNPMQQGGHSSFMRCRRCDKTIPRATVVCEYCRYPVRFRQRLRRVAWSVLGAAALASVAVLAVQMRAEYLPAPRTALSAPTAGALDEAPRTDAPAEAAPRAQQPPVTEGPPGGLERLVAQPAVAPGAAAPVPREVPPFPARGAETRWTTLWANLRATPDTLSPVLRPIAPGTPLVVAPHRAGWWRVFVDGVFAGYIAGDLLATVPPDTLPGPDPRP